MQPTNERPAHWWVLGYGMLIFLLLPRGVSVISDDFGYLGSVIETLGRHRPWTDDWLEPWAASLAAISAILYQLSGSFQFATQGLQVVCAIAACAGAYALCRSRDIAPGTSIAVSIFGLTFPALLWKAIDFTAVALYTPCLFWAIWAAHKRRWGMFFLAWAIAFASRQSAIVWLVLPLAEVIRASRTERGKIALSPPALVLWGALLTFVVLSVGMNHTQSQRMITQHVLEKVQLAASIRNLTITLGVGAVFSGLGALLLKWRPTGLSLARNIPQRVMIFLAFAVGLSSFAEEFPRLFAEHPNFEGWDGRLYSNIVTGAGIAGWLILRFALRWELLVASLAAGLLASLRVEVWDYYYADAAIFAFFSASPPRMIEPTEAFARPAKSVSVACIVLLAVFHLWFVFEQKCRVDRDYAVCVLSEKALRADELDVCDIAYAPYGFIGWQLHRHFVRHDGQGDPDIGGFMRYQRAGATELKFSPMRFWRDSKSLRPLGGELEHRVIRSEVFRVGWLRHQRISLLRSASPEQMQPARLGFDRSKYRPRPFPLTDLEWREHIEAPAP